MSSKNRYTKALGCLIYNMSILEISSKSLLPTLSLRNGGQRSLAFCLWENGVC